MIKLIHDIDLIELEKKINEYTENEWVLKDIKSNKYQKYNYLHTNSSDYAYEYIAIMEKRSSYYIAKQIEEAQNLINQTIQRINNG